MTKTTKKSSGKKKTKTEEKSAKTLFDHLNEIYGSQRPNYFDTLSETDKKTYNIYMMNRFLSMNPNQALAVNILQKYSTITPETHYKFCINVIPKGRQYNKYIKVHEEDRFEKWVVILIAKHFQVSMFEARNYLSIFYQTPENKVELRKILQAYGTSDKELKEVGL